MQRQRWERARERLVDAYAAGVLELPALQARCAALDARLAALREEETRWAAQCAQQQTLEVVQGHLAQFAALVRTRLGSLSWSERQWVIRQVVDRIEVTPETIEVVFRLRPPRGPESVPPAESSGGENTSGGSDTGTPDVEAQQQQPHISEMICHLHSYRLGVLYPDPAQPVDIRNFHDFRPIL